MNLEHPTSTNQYSLKLIEGCYSVAFPEERATRDFKDTTNYVEEKLAR